MPVLATNGLLLVVLRGVPRPSRVEKPLSDSPDATAGHLAAQPRYPRQPDGSASKPSMGARVRFGRWFLEARGGI